MAEANRVVIPLLVGIGTVRSNTITGTYVSRRTLSAFWSSRIDKNVQDRRDIAAVHPTNSTGKWGSGDDGRRAERLLLRDLLDYTISRYKLHDSGGRPEAVQPPPSE